MTTTTTTALERELSGALLGLTPYEAARVGVICRQTAAAAIREAARYAGAADPPWQRLDTLGEAIRYRLPTARHVAEALRHVVRALDGEAAAGHVWASNLRAAALDEDERPAVRRALEVLGVLAQALAAPPDGPERPPDSWEYSSWMAA